MSVNKYSPSVIILPEDEADRQCANGFALLTRANKQLQILPSAGGWTKVMDTFESVYVSLMEKHSSIHMVLLLDFDGKENRRSEITAKIPEGLRGRVLLIGSYTDPQELRSKSGKSFERIGETLAEECETGARQFWNHVWNHDLLKHNTAEVDRVGNNFRAILFPKED